MRPRVLSGIAAGRGEARAGKFAPGSALVVGWGHGKRTRGNTEMRRGGSFWWVSVWVAGVLMTSLGPREASALLVCTDSPEIPLPVVEMVTDLGTIQILLCSADVPDTVDNFLQYVNEGAYTTTGFMHRSVQEGIFIIQGGGFFVNSGTFMDAVTTRPPIARELVGLQNLRGTIAMARTNDPDSATSQWFINVQDNEGFDSEYAVFGEVAQGMDVVDAIAGQGIWSLNDSPLGELPLVDYPEDGSSHFDYLVYVTNVVELSEPAGLPEPGAAIQIGIGVFVLAGLAGRHRRRGFRDLPSA
jgi:cyclophilin family peptidyl-prolyl cis-trans isomerase